MTTKPTPKLVEAATAKWLDGDKRAAEVLKRWIVDAPDATIQALDNAIAAKLGYPREEQ